MASIKEKAQQENQLYQGLTLITENIKKNNPQLFQSEPVQEILKKITANKNVLRTFIDKCDNFSEKQQQEAWAELKAKNKILVSNAHIDSMKEFFQSVDSSIAKTEEYKNFYKIYLENMVSEKAQKVNNWKKEKEKLTIRQRAVLEAKKKYDDPESGWDFERAYNDEKGNLEYVKEVMEHERCKNSPEYFKLQEEYTKKYGEKGGVLIEDQEYLTSLLRSCDNRKTSLEKELKNNSELSEKKIAEIKNEIEEIKKREERLFEMSNDAAILRDARERADSSSKMKEYKKHYEDIMERLAPMEAIKKEADAVKEEAEKLEKEIAGDEIVEGIKNIADMLAKQEGMHKGNHTNSKSYQQMMDALDIVKGWNDENAPQDWQLNENAPKTLNEALELLEKSAQAYLDEKMAQFRPFPTALRESRITLGKEITQFAKDSLSDLKLPRKELVVENTVKVQERQQETSQRESTRYSIDAFSINNVL